MRVGFVSAPLTSTTGYGKVTKEVCFRLADMGYEVVNVGGRLTSVVLGEKFYAWTPEGNRVLVVPVFGQTGDKATLEHYIGRYNLDVIISLYDAYVLNFGKPSKPWAAQIPIDTHLTSSWTRYVLNADYLVSMSWFGYEELLKCFPDFMVRHIPHGCSPSVFRPRSDEERLEIRRKWGIPENVVLYLSVAANWGERKCLPQLLIAFKRLLKTHKDVMGYLYTNLRERCPQGYDLMTFAEQLGIADRVLGPKFNPMLDSVEDETLAELYAASDVLVNVSLGEGFGLSIIEAQACGIPVIATNYSSMTELVQDRGWLVETVPRDVWEDVPVWIPLLARYPVPNLNSLLKCMNDAYDNPERRKDYGKASRKFALNYSWEKLMPKWDKLIKEMVEEKP